MYELWYDYVKPKFEEKTKLCYIDTESIAVYKKRHKTFTQILQKMLKQD